MIKRSVQESDETGVATRLRLIEAAGEVFAAKGFKAATVRDICTRAGANVAAINYHFGDKEKLYAQVLRYAHACAIQRHPPDMGAPAVAPAEARLRAFIVSFFRRMFDQGRPAWHGTLIWREVMSPTPALARLVKADLHPRRDQLTGIVREIIGPSAQVDDLLLRHCVLSIVGQCLSFYLGRPMLEELYPEQRFDAAGIEERAEYVYHFSLGAIKSLRSRPARAAERAGASSRGPKRAL